MFAWAQGGQSAEGPSYKGPCIRSTRTTHHCPSGGMADDGHQNVKKCSAFGAALAFIWRNVSPKESGGGAPSGRPQDKSARPASSDRPGPSYKGPWIRPTRTTHHGLSGGMGDDERYNFKKLSAFGSSLVFNWGNVLIRKGGGCPQDKSARPASPDRPGPSCKGPWIRSTRTTHHCPSGEMGDDGHQHFKKLSAGGAALVFSWGDVPRLKGGGCALRTNQRGLPPQTVQVRVAKARGSDPLGQRITVHRGNGR